jgi:hypothetical protein
LGTPEAICEEMGVAGFENLEVVPKRVVFSAPSVEAFWEEQTRASAPIVAAKRATPERGWPAIEQRILAALTDACPGEVRFERVAWIATGVRPLYG